MEENVKTRKNVDDEVKDVGLDIEKLRIQKFLKIIKRQ